jgi:hypothetical protein
MKQISFFMMVALIAISTAAFSQSKDKTVEVLYFKAKQCACKTRVCDALEGQIKTLIEKDFPGENIEFKRVWLNDKENATLIEKYNAKAQTVVMVNTKRNKELATDLTETIKNLAVKVKTETAEIELKTLIAENL